LDDEFIALFSYELAFFKQVQSEKIELLNKAISIAKKMNSKNNEMKYFQKLVEVSPKYSLCITKENIYSVAKDFEASREFDKARDLYLEIINSDANLNEKIKSYNAYRMSFKVARDLSIFLQKTGEMELYLRQLLATSPDDASLQEAWIEAKINYARAIWTEHLNEDAKSILEDIYESKMGNINQLATVDWIYGLIHLESKNNNEALDKFEKASQLKVSNLDLQENIQWSSFWTKFLLKKYKTSVIEADSFIKKSINPNFINKLKFWKAMSLSKLKLKSASFEILKELSLEDSFGYYGLVASMKIEAPLSPLVSTKFRKSPISNLLFDWLFLMDEKIFSAKYLKEINPQFKTKEEKERAMPLYAETGWYQGGMSQLFNFPIKMRDDLTKKYISSIFPTANADIFTKFSKRYNISDAYVFAITRQESAFNPNVRSWADAFGLMQMIPEKASELSKKYAIKYENFNDLYRPDVNIEMGAALLAELYKEYSGNFIKSTAAYNASSEAISVWEKERFNGNYLEFIEMIPYEETRNYIKLVFRNYITYKRILAKKDFTIRKDFFSEAF
jgi:soluble lytic murein transglycosylase